MVIKIDSDEINDLATLNILDEEYLLRELRLRYRKGIIYTYIGDVLLAINPFKQLNIYEKQQHDLYISAEYRNDLPPHIFWIANQAYRKVCRSNKNQCIVVTGESGAGKTESTKLMVSHIIHCSGDACDRELQNRIIETSPLLEAFGNAQTCRNVNSSRFGKYLQLNFTETGRIIGAKVYEYLLEKSRIVQHGPGERTFHFFYYLFAGLEKESLEYLSLDNPENYRILKDPCGGKVFPNRADFKHCRQMFNNQKEIMQRIGFTQEDINMIFTILSAILHLTNIRFKHDDDTDGVYIENEYPLEVVCNLLALDQDILTMGLISTFNVTKGEHVISLKNVDQANDCRDALAKALYERLFSWIVKHINTLLQPTRRHNHIDEYPTRICSILDMSGFENFQMNSFEQLCINVANEHIQYYFNENIFLHEEEDYQLEGISFSRISFQNNEDLIELFMGPLGIFALLDEESHFPKANDQSLVQKFHSHCKNHSRYIKPRGNETTFGIHHYAGKVVYNARGFLEKNRDNLSANLVECMEKSTNELISHLFMNKDDFNQSEDVRISSALPLNMDDNQKKYSSNFDRYRSMDSINQKRMHLFRNDSKSLKTNLFQKERFNQNTVTIHFKASLNELLEKMKETEPSFVRCIKPNHGKIANQFDEELVQEQLRYNGILEISSIRNQGWPVRFTFEDFLKRYKFLVYSQTSPIRVNATNCEKILKHLQFTDYVLGKSKIFLKFHHLEILNHHYENYHSKIIKCQKIIRGFLVRRNLLRHAKQNANERHIFLTQIHSNGKRTLEKLVSLSKVSSKSIKQTPAKSSDGQGRLGHFIKKRSKDQRKSTDETIQMNEQEHQDMLKVAKKLQLLEKDDIDELTGVDHRITSSKNSDTMKPSIEGLTEREVRILVQDQFTPMTSRQGYHKNHSLESNIQAGSGLPTTSTSSSQQIHDGNMTGMMNSTTSEQLIRQQKIAAASGDLFSTDWAVGQKEGKHVTAVRSKSEPRYMLADLHDQNMLSEQKRDIVKKILILQRQKFKDNQARKSRLSNEFESSAYNFIHMNSSTEQDALLNGDTVDPWDAPRAIDVREAYEKTVHCYRLSMRMLKFATYIVLSIGVLVTALVSKGALLLMTNSVANVQETPYRERWVWMLLTTVSAPYIFTFFDSLGKCLFANKPWPSVKIFTVVFFIETLHSFGIVIFVFHILPKLDAARSLLIMNAVCLVPAFLKLFLTKSNSSLIRRSLLFLMDFFAFVMQCSCVAIALASKFLKNDGSTFEQTTESSLILPTTTDIIPLLNRHRRQDESITSDLMENILTTPMNNISTIDQNLQTILAGFHIQWELPVALILVSLAWWENFVDRDIKIGGRTIVHMKLLKENIIATRAKTSLIITIWKIFVTILFAYLFHHGIFNTSVIFPSNHFNEQIEDPLPKLSSGSNSWATLGFDQQPLPIVAPRERRSIINETIEFIQRNKRQIDNDLLSQVSNDEDLLNAMANGAYQSGNEQVHPRDRWIFYLAPMIIKVLSDALCFYMGRLACKLCMQRICFALPITLVTPLALTILLVMCSIAPQSTVFIENFLFWSCYADYAKESFRWQVVCGLVLWWLSELWIGGHVWFGKSQRLAFTERLFVAPRYCASLLEQSLMMNRRRNERDDFLNDNYDEMVTSKSETQFDEQSIEELSIEKKLSADVHTKIYSCATMWHETETEMLQLLKSIMRLDSDQCARRTARNYLHLKDLDYYEYEGHIFFDDAMEEDENNEQVPNKFVQQLLGVVDRAATAIHQCPMKIPPPLKTPTPYGGRLTWVLPGGNFLIAHIKDKTKIRHKKRWSQVMYMYYLLGYRLFGDLNIIEKLYKRKRKKNSPKNKSKLFKGFGNLLNNMDNKKRIQMENTYLLALDGDVDFRPEAVRLLVDRMKKNKKVGAACGRIHPIGSGPVVWYQKFEYAIGHWLQKAAEHILGCVMCSPGCFSLFRGSALMDDHVLRTYSTKSTEARHYVQYDQGEDRWLCTLLLQEGYRVEYCAASDALTYAPETFHEFFNQRRRWVPSTIANIMDFLAEYKRIVLVNESISYLYIIYQLFLMVSTVLGPATVLLMIIGAFNACFGTSLWQSMYMSVLPAFFYLLLCFHTTTDFQIRAAAFLSALYAIIMMAVVVGTTIQIAEDSWTSPNAVFLMLLFSIFSIAACMHPQEFWCIVPGLLYFLCIPSGYLFLLIYSLCNLNIVSWGTREAPKLKKNLTKEEMERAKLQELTQAKQKSAGFLNQVFSNFNFKKYDERIRSCARKWLGLERSGLNGILLRQILGAVERMEKNKFDEEMDAVATTGLYPQNNRTSLGSDVDAKYELIQLATQNASPTAISSPLNRTNHPHTDQQQLHYRGMKTIRSTPYGQVMSYAGASRPSETPAIKRDELVNPAWIFHESLRDSPVVMLDPHETKFFQDLIGRYLYPLVEDKDHQKKMVRDLKALRNNGCFVFFMINTLWLVIIFSLQLVSERIRDYFFIPIKRLHNEPLRFEPLGLAFLLFFATIQIVQFVSMLWHRYGTLLHLLASTDLKIGRRNNGKNNRSYQRGEFNTDNVEDAVEQVKVLQQLKGFDEEDLPEPDYNNDEKDNRHASEPDLSTTGLVYHGGGRQLRSSLYASQQWSDTAKVNDMQRNLDTTDHSDLSQLAGGYMSGSVKTYGSNYEAIKRRQLSNKRHLYNKSLDHVFKSRYQALTQQQQTQKNPRIKLTDVFQQQQQQLVVPRARRTSSALTVHDSDHVPSKVITKKHRRKSKDRHLEHL